MPAIIFNFSRKEIERMLKKLVEELEKRQYDKCAHRYIIYIYICIIIYIYHIMIYYECYMEQLKAAVCSSERYFGDEDAKYRTKRLNEKWGLKFTFPSTCRGEKQTMRRRRNSGSRLKGPWKCIL